MKMLSEVTWRTLEKIYIIFLFFFLQECTTKHKSYRGKEENHVILQKNTLFYGKFLARVPEINNIVFLEFIFEILHDQKL